MVNKAETENFEIFSYFSGIFGRNSTFSEPFSMMNKAEASEASRGGKFCDI